MELKDKCLNPLKSNSYMWVFFFARLFVHFEMIDFMDLLPYCIGEERLPYCIGEERAAGHSVCNLWTIG